MRKEFEQAYAVWENGVLEIGTGRFVRKWNQTELGFVTEDILLDGHSFAAQAEQCDHNIFGLMKNRPCDVGSVDFYISDDSSTAPCLEVVLMMTYPSAELCVKHVIRAYPGAPGLRTQLFLKRYITAPQPRRWLESIAESFRLPEDVKTAEFFGYYNHTQNRNSADKEILRRERAELTEGTVCDWASGAILYGERYGLCVVKENNKCVNQSAYETGAFKVQDGLFCCTGIGLLPDDLSDTEFDFAWATWTLAFDGAENAEQAIKQFDRMRYPIDPSRDIYVMSNTWGSCGGPKSFVNRDVSHEKSILEELEVAKKVGVEVLQIDDGWNAPFNERGRKESDKLWYVHKEKFPNGWAPIRQKAAECGVKLGLWFAWYATTDEMIENQRQGDFRYFKIDFAYLCNRKRFNYLYRKAQRLSRECNVRVNWDVTENDPRMGYYLGREFGNIYLENRKPEVPKVCIYTPYLILRDAWHVAKYTNLNKFQITLQNLEQINREYSDAYLHNYRYCTMIACLGAPLLFQELKYLSDSAIVQIRQTLDVYKAYRNELFQSIAYPIGDCPNNRAWTAMQYITNEKEGHLIVFRERENTQTEREIVLRDCNGKKMRLSEVFDGTEETVQADANGAVRLKIDTPCSVKWYKYRVE